MASIYQRTGSAKWWARIKTAAGRWESHALSCYHKDVGKGPAVPHKAALLEAEEMEALGKASRLETVSVSHMVELAKRVTKRNLGNKIKRETIREYLQRWLKNTGIRTSERTAESYEEKVNRFLEIMDDDANRPLTALDLPMLEQHRDALLEEGLASGTVILHCKTIGSAVTAAHEKGLIGNNPFLALDLPAKSSCQKKPFTDAEARAVIAAAKGEWKTVCLFGLYLGARQGDCTSMKWENIDLFQNTITYTPDKQKRGNEKPLTVSIHPALQQHLAELKRASGLEAKGLITPKLEQLGPGGRTGLSGQFAQIMRKAGITSAKTERTSGRTFSEKSFHSFRHTLTTLLAKEGVSEEVRRKVTGHKSKDVHQIYTHLDLEDQQKALAKLADFTVPSGTKPTLSFP